MSKAPGLAGGLKRALAATGETPEAAQAAPAPAADEAPPAPLRRQRGGRRAKTDTSVIAVARVDKKAVVGYFHPDVNKWLRGEALEEDTTLQRVMFDCINMRRKAKRLDPFPDTYESPDGT